MKNQNEHSKETESSLYIVFLETKETILQPSRIRQFALIMPDTQNLLRQYALTYQKYYWCDEYAVRITVDSPLIMIHLLYDMIGEDLLKFLSRILGYLVAFHSKRQALQLSNKIVESYIYSSLQKTDFFEDLFENANTEEIKNIVTQLRVACYYILCDVVGYRFLQPKPTIMSQNFN